MQFQIPFTNKKTIDIHRAELPLFGDDKIVLRTGGSGTFNQASPPPSTVPHSTQWTFECCMAEERVFCKAFTVRRTRCAIRAGIDGYCFRHTPANNKAKPEHEEKKLSTEPALLAGRLKVAICILIFIMHLIRLL